MISDWGKKSVPRANHLLLRLGDGRDEQIGVFPGGGGYGKLGYYYWERTGGLGNSEKLFHENNEEK